MLASIVRSWALRSQRSRPTTVSCSTMARTASTPTLERRGLLDDAADIDELDVDELLDGLVRDDSTARPTGSSRLQQIGPARAVDTRVVGVGGARRLPGGSTTVFDLGGHVRSATSTAAVAVNLTAVEPAQAGHVTVCPCDGGRLDTSSVNFAQGETRPDNAVVAISQGRYLCVYADTGTDLLLDVTGAMNPMGLSYLAAAPTRPGRPR